MALNRLDKSSTDIHHHVDIEQRTSVAKDEIEPLTLAQLIMQSPPVSKLREEVGVGSPKGSKENAVDYLVTIEKQGVERRSSRGSKESNTRRGSKDAKTSKDNVQQQDVPSGQPVSLLKETQGDFQEKAERLMSISGRYQPCVSFVSDIKLGHIPSKASPDIKKKNLVGRAYFTKDGVAADPTVYPGDFKTSSARLMSISGRTQPGFAVVGEMKKVVDEGELDHTEKRKKLAGRAFFHKLSPADPTLSSDSKKELTDIIPRVSAMQIPSGRLGMANTSTPGADGVYRRSSFGSRDNLTGSQSSFHWQPDQQTKLRDEQLQQFFRKPPTEFMRGNQPLHKQQRPQLTTSGLNSQAFQMFQNTGTGEYQAGTGEPVRAAQQTFQTPQSTARFPFPKAANTDASIKPSQDANIQQQIQSQAINEDRFKMFQNTFVNPGVSAPPGQGVPKLTEGGQINKGRFDIFQKGQNDPTTALGTSDMPGVAPPNQSASKQTASQPINKGRFQMFQNAFDPSDSPNQDVPKKVEGRPMNEGRIQMFQIPVDPSGAAALSAPKQMEGRPMDEGRIQMFQIPVDPSGAVAQSARKPEGRPMNEGRTQMFQQSEVQSYQPSTDTRGKWFSGFDENPESGLKTQTAVQWTPGTSEFDSANRSNQPHYSKDPLLSEPAKLPPRTIPGNFSQSGKMAVKLRDLQPDSQQPLGDQKQRLMSISGRNTPGVAHIQDRCLGKISESSNYDVKKKQLVGRALMVEEPLPAEPSFFIGDFTPRSERLMSIGGRNKPGYVVVKDLTNTSSGDLGEMIEKRKVILAGRSYLNTMNITTSGSSKKNIIPDKPTEVDWKATVAPPQYVSARVVMEKELQSLAGNRRFMQEQTAQMLNSQYGKPTEPDGTIADPNTAPSAPAKRLNQGVFTMFSDRKEEPSPPNAESHPTDRSFDSSRKPMLPVGNTFKGTFYQGDHSPTGKESKTKEANDVQPPYQSKRLNKQQFSICQERAEEAPMESEKPDSERSTAGVPPEKRWMGPAGRGASSWNRQQQDPRPNSYVKNENNQAKPSSAARLDHGAFSIFKERPDNVTSLSQQTDSLDTPVLLVREPSVLVHDQTEYSETMQDVALNQLIDIDRGNMGLPPDVEVDTSVSQTVLDKRLVDLISKVSTIVSESKSRFVEPNQSRPGGDTRLLSISGRSHPGFVPSQTKQPAGMSGSELQKYEHAVTEGVKDYVSSAIIGVVSTTDNAPTKTESGKSADGKPIEQRSSEFAQRALLKLQSIQDIKTKVIAESIRERIPETQEELIADQQQVDDSILPSSAPVDQASQLRKQSPPIEEEKTVSPPRKRSPPIEETKAVSPQSRRQSPPPGDRKTIGKKTPSPRPVIGRPPERITPKSRGVSPKGKPKNQSARPGDLTDNFSSNAADKDMDDCTDSPTSVTVRLYKHLHNPNPMSPSRNQNAATLSDSDDNPVDTSTYVSQIASSIFSQSNDGDFMNRTHKEHTAEHGNRTPSNDWSRAAECSVDKNDHMAPSEGEQTMSAGLRNILQRLNMSRFNKFSIDDRISPYVPTISRSFPNASKTFEFPNDNLLTEETPSRTFPYASRTLEFPTDKQLAKEAPILPLPSTTDGSDEHNTRVDLTRSFSGTTRILEYPHDVHVSKEIQTEGDSQATRSPGELARRWQEMTKPFCQEQQNEHIQQQQQENKESVETNPEIAQDENDIRIHRRNSIQLYIDTINATLLEKAHERIPNTGVTQASELQAPIMTRDPSYMDEFEKTRRQYTNSHSQEAKTSRDTVLNKVDEISKANCDEYDRSRKAKETIAKDHWKFIADFHEETDTKHHVHRQSGELYENGCVNTKYKDSWKSSTGGPVIDEDTRVNKENKRSFDINEDDYLRTKTKNVWKLNSDAVKIDHNTKFKLSSELKEACRRRGLPLSKAHEDTTNDIQNRDSTKDTRSTRATHSICGGEKNDPILKDFAKPTRSIGHKGFEVVPLRHNERGTLYKRSPHESTELLETHRVKQTQTDLGKKCSSPSSSVINIIEKFLSEIKASKTNMKLDDKKKESCFPQPHGHEEFRFSDIALPTQSIQKNPIWKNNTRYPVQQHSNQHNSDSRNREQNSPLTPCDIQSRAKPLQSSMYSHNVKMTTTSPLSQKDVASSAAPKSSNSMHSLVQDIVEHARLIQDMVDQGSCKTDFGDEGLDFICETVKHLKENAITLQNLPLDELDNTVHLSRGDIKQGNTRDKGKTSCPRKPHQLERKRSVSFERGLDLHPKDHHVAYGNSEMQKNKQIADVYACTYATQVSDHVKQDCPAKNESNIISNRVASFDRMGQDFLENTKKGPSIIDNMCSYWENYMSKCDETVPVSVPETNLKYLPPPVVATSDADTRKIKCPVNRRRVELWEREYGKPNSSEKAKSLARMEATGSNSSVSVGRSRSDTATEYRSRNSSPSPKMDRPFTIRSALKYGNRYDPVTGCIQRSSSECSVQRQITPQNDQTSVRGNQITHRDNDNKGTFQRKHRSNLNLDCINTSHASQVPIGHRSDPDVCMKQNTTKSSYGNLINSRHLAASNIVATKVLPTRTAQKQPTNANWGKVVPTRRFQNSFEPSDLSDIECDRPYRTTERQLPYSRDRPGRVNIEPKSNVTLRATTQSSQVEPMNELYGKMNANRGMQRTGTDGAATRPITKRIHSPVSQTHVQTMVAFAYELVISLCEAMVEEVVRAIVPESRSCVKCARSDIASHRESPCGHLLPTFNKAYKDACDFLQDVSDKVVGQISLDLVQRASAMGSDTPGAFRVLEDLIADILETVIIQAAKGSRTEVGRLILDQVNYAGDVLVLSSAMRIVQQTSNSSLEEFNRGKHKARNVYPREHQCSNSNNNCGLIDEVPNSIVHINLHVKTSSPTKLDNTNNNSNTSAQKPTAGHSFRQDAYLARLERLANQKFDPGFLLDKAAKIMCIGVFASCFIFSFLTCLTRGSKFTRNETGEWVALVFGSILAHILLLEPLKVFVLALFAGISGKYLD